MAKNRSKKKRDVAMDIIESSVSSVPEAAMDNSELGAHTPATGAINRKVKMGRPMKRTKNVRKMKAVAKAIAKGERSVEKILKNEDKASRTQFAKLLYD